MSLANCRCPTPRFTEFVISTRLPESEPPRIKDCDSDPEKLPTWRGPSSMNKKALSERDICTKFITPAMTNAGWDMHTQIREEVCFTKGRVIVRGKMTARGEPKSADYILYYKPNIPIAVIEAKDNNHVVGAGMQQALEYAEILDVPFAYSSNGDAFLEHDRTGSTGTVEREFPLERIPVARRTLAAVLRMERHWPKQSGPSSSRTTTPTAAARARATTSSSPSTAPSKPSPRGRIASCS